MKLDALQLGKILHIRALNHLRREHPLTYLGGRILAESVDAEILDDWTTSYLMRRAKTGRQPVYWQHSLFKALDKAGEPEFRPCRIGSPTTHLLEVWVLWKLSQEAAFMTRPAVYSNLWSNSASHHIFTHFMKGYSERERAIARAAEQLKNPYVVVLDLKRFYPSIDRERAFERFKNRVEQSLIRGDERESVLQCAQGVCRPTKTNGLPIGPPLVHVLASIYLEDVDARLEQEFPGRYFRYVDDVALVVEKAQVRNAKRLFTSVVENEGLLVNEDKTDEHPASVWKQHVETKEAAQLNVTFGSLISHLSQYLAHNPHDFDMLKSRFREEGFSLPFTSVKAVSEYRPFRRMAKKVLNYFGIELISGDVKLTELLEDARYLRTHFELRVNRIQDAALPSGGIQRRWAFQDMRYTFNRLLYLVPRESLGKYEELLPAIEDVAQTKAIYKAMVLGNITDLVHYAGPTVSAFAQLWSETETTKPQIEWSLTPKAHERDAVITLALYKLCEPPEEWIAKYVSKSGYNQTALRLAARPHPTKRTHSDCSYIDELETLFLTQGVNPLELLKTRFDKEEDIVLPALSLGAGSDMEVEMENDY